MTTTRMCLAGVVSAGLAFSLAAAVPALKGSPEPAGATGLKVKALQGGKAVQAITPKAQHWTFRRGEEKWTETHFDAKEIWTLHERGAQWKDRKGNELTLATPTAFCPDFEKGHAKKEDIEKMMSEGAEAFKDPTDEALARWAGEFSGKILEASALAKLDYASAAVEEARMVDFGGGPRFGTFFKTKDGAWRYAEFRLAQEAKPNELAGLAKKFLAGVALDKAKAAAGKDAGVVMEGRWMTVDVPGYRFKTDLSKSQGQAFIKQSGRLMEAMQAAYRRYVPPVKDLGVSTVRVFSSREGYNEYMRGATGESGDGTIGLWSPSHEELLILDMGNSARAETLKTMRHEAFHQYLFYATGRGNHAMWFNEGHACFFENVAYDAKKNYVRVFDDPKDRRPRGVAENPERIAKLVKEILPLDHAAFYAGDLHEVNERYTAAWAVVYFLEKGVPMFKEFADYKGVLPTYLKAMNEGKSAKEATELAWEGVKDRDFAADFLKFWGKRGGAAKYEPPAEKQ